jgi:hypothetical protein
MRARGPRQYAGLQSAAIDGRDPPFHYPAAAEPHSNEPPRKEGLDEAQADIYRRGNCADRNLNSRHFVTRRLTFSSKKKAYVTRTETVAAASAARAAGSERASRLAQAQAEDAGRPGSFCLAADGHEQRSSDSVRQNSSNGIHRPSPESAGTRTRNGGRHRTALRKLASPGHGTSRGVSMRLCRSGVGTDVGEWRDQRLSHLTTGQTSLVERSQIPSTNTGRPRGSLRTRVSGPCLPGTA